MRGGGESLPFAVSGISSASRPCSGKGHGGKTFVLRSLLDNLGLSEGAGTASALSL